MTAADVGLGVVLCLAVLFVVDMRRLYVEAYRGGDAAVGDRPDYYADAAAEERRARILDFQRGRQ